MKFTYDCDGAFEIVIVPGDITQRPVDAIVNAANADLARGGGVCGAIYDAAGQQGLEDAVQAALIKQARTAPIGVGQVLVSGVPASTVTLSKTVRYVVHAVGPDCRMPAQHSNRAALLQDAYKNSLLQADKAGIKSISFPAISTAIYACPALEARDIALNTVLATMQQTGIKRVEFVFLITMNGNPVPGGYDGYRSYVEYFDALVTQP